MRMISATIGAMLLASGLATGAPDGGTEAAETGTAPGAEKAPASAGPLELSIDDALRRAQQGSEQVDIARAGLRRSEAEKVRARSEWLPQLSASAGYDRTLASEFEDLFEDIPSEGEGQPTGGENPFEDLPFGQENTYRFGLSFTYNLFAGGRRVAQSRLAALGYETGEVQLASARAQAVLDVAQAYFDAVLSEQLLTIAEATLKRAEETLELTRVGQQVGNVPEFDLLRAQVTFENQKPVVLQRRYERDLAALRLKQLLELPLERALKLTSSLEEGELQPVDVRARDVAGVPERADDAARPAVRQAAAAVEASSAALRIARSQYFPLISLGSQYGRVAYPEDLFPGWSDFRTNWTVGLALQVPLFTGFRTRGDVIAAEADLSEARARLRQAEELSQLDTRGAREQLATARATWLASAGTVGQAQRAWTIAELRYREGVSNQLELSDARLLLQQAEANRARAARDLQVARIRVMLLPHLPLSASGGMTGGMTGGMAGGQALEGATWQGTTAGSQQGATATSFQGSAPQ